MKKLVLTKYGCFITCSTLVIEIAWECIILPWKSLDVNKRFKYEESLSINPILNQLYEAIFFKISFNAVIIDYYQESLYL
jgi:hypothetical protein